jgi:hypothetical protein
MIAGAKESENAAGKILLFGKLYVCRRKYSRKPHFKFSVTVYKFPYGVLHSISFFVFTLL